MMKHDEQLTDFMTALSKGVEVNVFLKEYKALFPLPKENRSSYRLAENSYKKLCDEVTPVARFVKKQADTRDKIRFNLNSSYPDCILTRGDGREQEMEVTVARGLARYHEMTGLNERGLRHGFLDLQNNASKADIATARNREPEMYTTDQALDHVVEAIKNAAKVKKNHVGDTLLIEVVPDMLVLSPDRWCRHLPGQLTADQTISVLEFREIFVTSYCDGDFVLPIKQEV